MQRQTTPTAHQGALVAILHEIEAERSALGLATPERQRLAMTRWIARARALAQTLGSPGADAKVGRVARTLQEFGQLWWPGGVIALARTTLPQHVFPGLDDPPRTWDAVVTESTIRIERTSGWADALACTPGPYDSGAMFAAACTALIKLGGPLGRAAPLAAGVTRAAAAHIPELMRIAAELRWLRGTAPARLWAAAIGRLRGLVRGLGRDGGPIAALLDPSFAPPSWAHHLGRHQRPEDILGRTPDGACDAAIILAWLLRAFDVLDTPTLITRCQPLRPQLLALHPQLASRRDRRRLSALQAGLVGTVASHSEPSPAAMPAPPELVDPSRIVRVRACFAGQRALFISNRSFPELEAKLDKELGLVCDAVASVDAPRRRQALLQRIRGGTYDLVLVAHEFSGHADTEQFSEACKSAGVLYCAVGKGRFTRVVSALLESIPPPSLAAA